MLVACVAKPVPIEARHHGDKATFSLIPELAQMPADTAVLTGLG